MPYPERPAFVQAILGLKPQHEKFFEKFLPDQWLTCRVSDFCGTGNGKLRHGMPERKVLIA